MKPELIDKLVKEDKTVFRSTLDEEWYIAKPLEYQGIYKYFERIHHAILILRGKACAHRYHQDEKIFVANKIKQLKKKRMEEARD